MTSFRPLQYVGKDAYMKDWKDFFAGFKRATQDGYEGLPHQSSGNLATVECLDFVSGTMTNGTAFNSWLRATAVLRKDNGKWLDIHDHVSYPADMGSGKAIMDLKP